MLCSHFCGHCNEYLEIKATRLHTMIQNQVKPLIPSAKSVVGKQMYLARKYSISKHPIVETHLDDRVSPRCGFDGSSAAFSLVMSSVMSFGVNLDL